MSSRVDVEQLLEVVDLQQIAMNDLGKPFRSGKANMYRCPFHHETHGASLAVWRDGWRCFGKCNTGGNAVDWVMKLHQKGFMDAVDILGGKPVGHTYGKVGRKHYVGRFYSNHYVKAEAYSNPPDTEWQAEARIIADEAQQTLWGPAGTKALNWLRARGLESATIKAARIGYLPGSPTYWHRFKQFVIPSGITLPWYVGEDLWGIKVRLAGGDVKYMQASGGSIAGSLYWSVKHRATDGYGIVSGWPILFVEGEFDCLIAHQEAGDLVCVVTLGSKSGRVNPRWLPLTWAASDILLGLDADEAGDDGAKALTETFPKARRVRVPLGKDVNGLHLEGGRHAVRSWIERVLEEQLQEQPAE